MDALDLLRVDHRRISDLIQQVGNELDPQTGQAPAHSFEKLTREIRTHKQMLRQQLEFDMDAVRTHQSDFDSAIYPASRLGPKA
jgi:hypothetical protein